MIVSRQRECRCLHSGTVAQHLLWLFVGNSHIVQASPRAHGLLKPMKQTGLPAAYTQNRTRPARFGQAEANRRTVQLLPVCHLPVTVLSQICLTGLGTSGKIEFRHPWLVGAEPAG